MTDKPALKQRILRDLREARVGWLLPFLVLAAGIWLYLLELTPLQMSRNLVFDQYQRWQPRVYQPVPVRVVDIDDASLARLGQWPWPRTRIAELVQRLREAGAAVIVFDVAFAEPDRTSPASLLKSWDLPPAARQTLAGLPDHDRVLAETLAQGNDVVLGHALLRQGNAPEEFTRPFRVIQLGPSPLPYLSRFDGSVLSLPLLQRAAAGNGAMTFDPDLDGVVRRVPLLLGLRDEAVPSLVAEALRVGLGTPNILLKTADEAGLGIEEVRIGELTIPTDQRGEVWVHYTEPVAERYLPAWRVLARQAPQEQLQGHVVLVGTSAQGLLDLRFSPRGGLMPGVEAHAQALEQILSGVTLNRPNWAPGLEVLGILLGSLLVGVIALKMGALLSALAAALTLGATLAGGWYAFTEYGLLLDPVSPGLIMMLVFVFSSLLHHIASERRQRWVKEAFARYVSPNLVSHLVDNPGQLELGGQRRECSFIFTDLAGFTSLMESLDPAQAVALLNDYLDNMIRIAFQHEGTLDRIVGDAVAIMFSAPVEQPDHRQRALRCALAMHRYAWQHAAAAQARGIAFGHTRIGVHTGEVTVGNFGGGTIFDYRALGDPVNTAARLESVNKQLGTWLCVSEATLTDCPELPVRRVGRLVLKGKNQDLLVFEPLVAVESAWAAGRSPEAPDADYDAAYDLMVAEDPAALAAFEALAYARPDDGLVRFHLNRLRAGQTGDRVVLSEK